MQNIKPISLYMMVTNIVIDDLLVIILKIWWFKC